MRLPLDRFGGVPVAFLGQLDKFVHHETVAIVSQLGIVAQRRRRRSKRLPAPRSTAGAFWTVRVERNMAELACHATRSRDELSVGKHPGPDAF